MPRVVITTTCRATVTEEWVVDVTDSQLAQMQREEPEEAMQTALTMTDGAASYVNVENVKVEDEGDRQAKGFEVVTDDFTNAGAADFTTVLDVPSTFGPIDENAMGGLRRATEAETAAWLAGHVAIEGSRETDHGLLVPDNFKLED